MKKGRLQDTELRNQLSSAAEAASRTAKKIAKKLKLSDSVFAERIKKDFDYCQKLNSLTFASEYVLWAYEWLSDESLLPDATECVKNCLKELTTTLNAVLAEKGTHEQ